MLPSDAPRHAQRPAAATGFSVRVLEADHGLVVLELGGELDLFSAPELRAALQTVLADAAGVCLDVRAVPFLDTTGLSVLLGARRALRNRNAGFALVGAGRAVADVLDQAGLGELLRRYDRLEDALEALGA